MNEDGLKRLLEKLNSLPSVEIKKSNPVKTKKLFCVYIKKANDDFLENFASQIESSKTQLINNAINLFIESFERLFYE